MKHLVAVSLAAVLLTSVACTDEGEKEDCVGLKCPAGQQWPDAGEVRVWAVRLPNGDLVLRFFGFFYDPDATSIDETIAPSPIGKGICAEEKTFGWQPTERAYLDVGEKITFELASGQNVDVPKLVANPDAECMVPAVPCAAGIPDWFGRMHQGPAYILETFTPAAMVDEGVYNGFHSIVAETDIPNNPNGNRIDGLFLGPSFNILEPERDAMATVTLNKGEPLHFEYEFEQVMTEPVVMASAIVFNTPSVMGVRPTACLELPTGQQDIPASAIDALAADTGFMLVGNGADQTELFGERQFHKWGIFCNFFPWQRVE